MLRRSKLMFALVGLSGCPGSTGGNTLVYALEQEVVGTPDPSLCAAGAGLDIDLGLQDAIAFQIAPGGGDALLATCVLEEGEVQTCGTLVPETRLDLVDDVVTGSSTALITLEGDCDEATLQLAYRLFLQDDDLSGTATVVWQLADTPACETLENEIRAGANGIGVNGCLVTYPLEASFLATCDFDRAVPCR